jgi:zinc transport system permease protein
MSTQWLSEAIHWFNRQWPEYSFFSQDFNVRGLLAVILCGLICGAVGSLVMSNRMAFFSDALAHCSFAGVGLALWLGYFLAVLNVDKAGAFYQWGVPLIMIAFGALVGVGIAFVRERTGLANDTVIGVFFAGALGLGAVLISKLSKLGYFYNLEHFLFGNILYVNDGHLILLFGLAVVTFALLIWLYNPLVFASFNISLARSRRVPIRLCNYLFIVLLALIVNLCLWIVGVLLINGLLLVPAATAMGLSRNMRQLFWWTTGLCLLCGLGGIWLSWDVQLGDSGGSIVSLAVLLFFALMAINPWLRGRQPA